MGSRFPYIILFFLFSTKLFCQDIIIKKDSTKISAYIFKINPYTIRYLDFKERKQKIKTEDVSGIILKNGDEIRYKTPLTKHSTDTLLSINIKQKSHITKKANEYFKFNVMLGAVLNLPDCNRPTDPNDPDKKQTVQVTYKRPSNQNYRAGFNAGFNLLLGSSPYIKQIFGANYLQSNGEFDYRKLTLDPDSTDYYHKSCSSNLHIKTTDYFLNIVNGVRITFFRSLHLETCFTFNIPTISRSHVNGIDITQETGKQDAYYFTKDSIGKSSHVKRGVIAFNPKVTYEFKKRGQVFGVYASYNLNVNYNLQWFAFGITYYPFKKLI